MQMQGLKPHNKPRNTYLQIRQEIPLACRGGQHRQWSCETTQAYHSCPVLIHWCSLQLECLPVEKNPNQEMLILLCKSPSTNSMANLRPKSKTIVYQSSSKMQSKLLQYNSKPISYKTEQIAPTHSLHWKHRIHERRWQQTLEMRKPEEMFAHVINRKGITWISTYSTSFKRLQSYKGTRRDKHKE